MEQNNKKTGKRIWLALAAVIVAAAVLLGV